MSRHLQKLFTDVIKITGYKNIISTFVMVKILPAPYEDVDNYSFHNMFLPLLDPSVLPPPSQSPTQAVFFKHLKCALILDGFLLIPSVRGHFWSNYEGFT